MDSQVQEALKTAYPRYEKRRKTRVKMTLDLYVRRQVSAELGDDEPTKDERFILLQKFGVTAPRIDRQMTKPSWMGEAEWKRKLNDWYKSTKGLVPQTQPRRTTFSGVRSPRVWSSQNPRQGQMQPSLQTGVGEHSQGKRVFRQRETQGSSRYNAGRQERPSQNSGRDVRRVPNTNRPFGDRS